MKNTRRSSIRARIAADHARDFNFMTDAQIEARVAAAHVPDASGVSEWDRVLMAAEQAGAAAP